jgi:hypothetical protein
MRSVIDTERGPRRLKIAGKACFADSATKLIAPDAAEDRVGADERCSDA